VDKLPELAEIAAALAIVHYTIKATKWTWNHRKDFADKLGRTPKDIVINAQPLTLHAEVPPVHITVASERQILYNVEAPTPSLARRLEELASWYLHVS